MNMLPVFLSGMLLSLSLIMAIGPQNAHVLRMGLGRQHLLLTVLICALGDMAMILIGVHGLGHLGPLPERLHGALIGAGTLFLLAYGWRAAKRFASHWRAGLTSPVAAAGGAGAPAQPAHYTRRQAVGHALAFSWLNPHAWLDTAALIGTASLAYGQMAGVFGWGAIAGSAVWFSLLGLAGWWLGRRLQGSRAWLWLDGLVALMMWVVAALLAASLWR
ncbi:lysine transporter LysE [Corticibacter populi]|uniref:Lysine transporter LysE n=1 Tax=Corticibacter populi TaxID=1550736 RepID=A0A3M6QRW0_9BURK|nr:LysE family transporter [Corticibacter populi]RMX05785.1 lysine transporter LysE [Corticibacter populi]RZS30909.1 L-lysine exporter family protein LysE/ArgO [Corticibacter populi]